MLNAVHAPRAFTTLLAALTCGALLHGCATGRARPPEEALEPPSNPAPEPTAVQRYGRYTLVELDPTLAQQHLMEQVIDVTVPATPNVTVGDALHHVLLHSGYRLCEGDAETDALAALPLPAAHIQLGPLTLRDALTVLAGPAMRLEVDETARRVCFDRADEPLEKALPAAVRKERQS